ncbi:M48 family metalloprotease [Streptomyces sp. 1222.5]|uniref:M48 family metalloprotease n=1 Tax=Streptomyces sp. 1222.5 TaxID=1881026 RepID=UPI003D75DD8E
MSQPPDPSVPPPYPEPSYPDAVAPAPPAYPGPTAAAPPPYPGAPATPGPAPQYPTPPGPSYPIAATSPGPAYPSAATSHGPAHPTPTASPQPGPAYPTAASTHPDPGPAYPTAAAHPGPAYPTAATAPPYPGAAHAQPGPHTQAAPPPYPGSEHDGRQPGTAVPPQAHAPETAVPVPEPAPDDLDYRHRGARLHVSEHQRGADATAVGRLAVQLPGALVSLALVGSIALGMFGNVVGTLVVLAWVASGLLVFHRPTELAFARYVLKLRLPSQQERARLEPIWHEVTARAGIEPGTYELMVENSDELNAVAVAGHVVGVTTYSLNRIPSSNLAAVLAHELGHHTGGHAWAGLLGYWYSLPGRIAWAVTRGLARFAIAVAGVFSMAATGFLILFMALAAVAAFLAAWYIAVPLVLAPYLLAYAGRRGELRADQQAAELGFARQLAEVLYHFQTEEDTAKAALAARGEQLKEPGTLDRLLSSHPDHHTRLDALQPYLGLHR